MKVWDKIINFEEIVNLEEEEEDSKQD